MTSRVIDPSRQQGVTAELNTEGWESALPVTLEQALAAVAGWEAKAMPLFGLHRIAQALRDEVVRLRGELDAA